MTPRAPRPEPRPAPRPASGAREDEEFLRSYDASRFERPSVTVDVCVFSVFAARLSVLLVKRTEPPFAGTFGLPGGFVRMDESLEEAARRVLAAKVGDAPDIYLEQLYTFGAPDRDPRTRVVSVAYVALVTRERLARALAALEPARDAGWFEVRERRGRLSLVSPFDAEAEEPRLAFDHAEIVETAVRRIRGKLEYTTIAFQLLPERFTLTDLQRVYETVLGRKLAKAAFRRRVLDADVVKATGGERRGAHRPAKLYKFVRGKE